VVLIIFVVHVGKADDLVGCDVAVDEEGNGGEAGTHLAILNPAESTYGQREGPGEKEGRPRPCRMEVLYWFPSSRTLNREPEERGKDRL
jgi:hypothetical protein